MMDGKLIWITGLAGSGKTTIAKELYSQLKKEHSNVIHLDGDMVRTILGDHYGHNISDRKYTAGVYARLCSELTKQGIIVIMSTISLFHDIHNFNKEHNKEYYEILLESDHDLRSTRTKNDYSRSTLRRNIYATGQDVVGLDQNPELPQYPTLTLQNNDLSHIQGNVQKILDVVFRD